MWKILKFVPSHKLSRVKLGVDAIRDTYYLLKPRAEAYIEAINIYRKGHHDYIDALHYTSALAENILFLTIDYEFIEFLKEHDYKVEGVTITPKELKGLLNRRAKALDFLA